jgi:hypothetical protein
MTCHQSESLSEGRTMYLASQCRSLHKPGRNDQKMVCTPFFTTAKAPESKLLAHLLCYNLLLGVISLQLKRVLSNGLFHKRGPSTREVLRNGLLHNRYPISQTRTLHLLILFLKP